VVSGYVGGRFDGVMMRITDGVIALPLLPLLIVLAAIDPRKVGIPVEIAQSETFSLYRIVVIVALTGWTTVARLVRAETLSLKNRDFARAARALGAQPVRIMFRHILPNAAGSLVVATTMSIGTLILLESTLSFLGLGTQPPAASWGNMLTGAQELLRDAPMQAVWPGLLILLTVIAFNFLGDGLQDALDPRSERRT
jgi:peptide/nickel transport system permease protein